MKSVLSFLLATLAISIVAAVWTPGHSGQSACSDPLEYNQKFQHNLDPTRYWFCERQGFPATLMTCEHGTAYLHILRNCLPWGYWQWSEPMDPPTLAR